MTVCIAAISRKDNRIITASDFMLSTNFMSADTRTVKIQPIGSSKRWVSMFSGLPTVEAAVLSLANQTLANLNGEETSTEVVSAIEQAFRETLKRKIEGELLSPYGMDRATFMRSGRGWFGNEEFVRLLNMINITRLETAFLVIGFEPNCQPRIFAIEDPGVSESCDSLGFHAIGTGCWRALCSLYTTYDYNADLTVDQLIYRVCEAKFLGESALGVGDRTLIDILASDGTHEGLWPQYVSPVRNIWDKQGRSPIPDAALQMIRDSQHEIKWHTMEPPLGSKRPS